ncbi:MAG: type II toxin-antitoxin system VapC family toxin [Deltaproteobacteria bacterium]|nr:type II toxin-antitoxin system VapC family toxin [Deltaproteobacteria bacterium]
MLIDTDILIWALRGRVEAKRAITSIDVSFRYISVITHLELLEGIRNKAELRALKDWLNAADLKVVPLNESIGVLALALMEQHTLQNGLETDDALIAASALHYKQTLYTCNIKHFKNLGLELRQFSLL